MAVHTRHIILFVGVISLTKSLPLIQAELSEEDAKIEHLHGDLSIDDSGLKTRTLSDSIVSSTNGFHNFANNDSDDDQNFSNMIFDSGSGGTSDSFNNRGGGDQNFSGAVLKTGGTHGGTKDSFNSSGGGTPRFRKRAVFNLGSGTSGSFNNRGGGAQIGLDTAKFNTGPVTDSFNGRNSPPRRNKKRGKERAMRRQVSRSTPKKKVLRQQQRC